MKSVARALSAARGWAGERACSRGALSETLRRGFDWAYGTAVSGFPGLDGAEQLAARYGARHDDADAAVAALINWQCGVAGAAGFLTGCGGFVVLPAALTANLASALFIQTRLIAAIAHLRGHDINSANVRTLALACLTGSRAADTLKDAGVRFGTRLARDGIGWASPALFKKVQHAAGVPAVCVAGRSAAQLGKFTPVVGGVVAGGFDAAMTRLIGRTADRVFAANAAAARPEPNRPGLSR
jgi:hypothetical protein